MSFLTKIFGDPNAKVVSQIRLIVDQINSFEPALEKLSSEELKNKSIEFKERLSKGVSLDDILPEAFAVVREVSKRVTGMRHFDVQMIGGVVLHRGQISEMRTGEGKTLVATLPVYLNALAGKGVHLVTVNDYLAKRDAVWMGQIYDALGLTVGIIQNQMVSYRYRGSSLVIPAPFFNGVNSAGILSEIGKEDPGFRRDDSNSLAEGSEADKERDAKGMFKVESEYLEICSRPEAYRCDITYGTNNEFGFDYLRDNMVGSLEDMSQRPLNFAIVDEVDSILIDEARTPLIISAPAEEAADKYYKFAELVNKLQENDDYNVDEKMRSSTLTEGGLKKMEQWLGIENIYAEGGMSTVHHVEQALKAKALFKRDKDYVVENGEVIIVDEFTGRKMVGRRYSEGLHQAIEAKEGAKIQRESQTMATVTFQNYFRMYKKLAGMTGTAVTEAEEFGKIYNLEVVVIPTNKVGQRLDNADKIYRTEEAKYKAIAIMVKELQTKGQPVLIGTISVDKNEALSLFLEREGIKHEILNAKNHEREGEIIAQAGRAGAVTLATNMAGRGVDIILGGNPPDKESAEKVRTSGGLFVIGTERHESRRIDNQLRGRAGRQGDPGHTQFFLSTEDELMRIFAGDRIKSVMNSLKVPDDMPIENGALSRIIESAQKKVEGFHFDTRKHLLEYDDVLNRHREVIYGKRKKILEAYKVDKKVMSNTVIPAPFFNGVNSAGISSEINKDPGFRRDDSDNSDGRDDSGGQLRSLILENVEQEIEQVVSYHTNAEDTADWNMQEIYENVMTIFPLSTTEKEAILSMGKTADVKMARIDEAGGRTEIIEFLVKLSKEKYDELLVKKISAPAMLLEIEKQVLLRGIDNLWIDHLVAVDYLRTGIGLRGYGQRDPLVEYKKETYRMFNELLSAVQKEIVYIIYKLSIGVEVAPSVARQNKNMTFQGAQKTAVGDQVETETKPHDSSGKVIGRNDPCFCGSGKKFKKCHGK